MKVYKATDKDLQCRGFQYTPGVEAAEHSENLKLCSKGLHACTSPLDVFAYYDPGSGSRYFEANAEEVSDEKSNDSKIVCKRLTLGAEIGLPGLANAHVSYVMEHLDKEKNPATNTGYQSAATNTGNYSAATNTGDYSAATNTGDYSAATNTGDKSAATNTGDKSAATNTGRGGVALVTGFRSKASGAIGSAICVCERGEWNGSEFPLLAIKAAIIDGEILKPDTFYMLVNGEFQEVEEDN